MCSTLNRCANTCRSMQGTSSQGFAEQEAHGNRRAPREDRLWQNVVLPMQFFTAAGGTGAPATRTESPRASRSSGHGVLRGPRGPIDPIRPLWSAGTKNKQTDRHHHLIPVPHPQLHTTTHAGHPPPPRQVLDHPNSRRWGRVVKHHPAQPTERMAGLKPHSQAKNAVRDRAAG